MSRTYLAFLLKLSGLALCNFAILYGWNAKLESAQQLQYYYLIPVFYFLSTALIHHRLHLAAQKEPKKFVYAFLGTTSIRMLITIIFFISYILMVDGSIRNFAIAYVISYFVYLILEVVELQRFFYKAPKKQHPSP